MEFFPGCYSFVSPIRIKGCLRLKISYIFLQETCKKM
jgi:hypothetical protein